MIKYIFKAIFLLLTSLCFSLEDPFYAPEARELFIPVEGAELFCKVMGEGDPIIILHGGPGLRHDYLIPSLKKLAENHLVIFYDQRASGLSSGKVNQDTMTIEVFTNDIESIKLFFGFEKFTLIGHSWGAFLGINYVLAHPESVDKLIILSAPPLDLATAILIFKKQHESSKRRYEERKIIENSPEFLIKDPATMERYFEIRSSQHFYDPSKARPYYQLLNLNEPQDRAKINSAFLLTAQSCAFDFYPRLNLIHTPTLILHGDFDSIPISSAEKLHTSLPNSQYILFEKCGHALPLEYPKETIAAIESFLLNN